MSSPSGAGGRPRVELAAPNITDLERQLVWDALAQPELVEGPSVRDFEAAVADLVGLRYAVALSTGTAAIHLALLLVGVRPGDLVLMPALTFVAPANAVRYVGAYPVFFDCDEFRQLDVEGVDEWLATECERSIEGVRHRGSGARVGAVLPVDLYGHPYDGDSLHDVVAPYDLSIVEDAAEALGAQIRGRSVGANATIACLSFNVNKLVTTGGGGMLLTNDGHLAERARYLANQAKLSGSTYEHGAVGFNYRLSSAAAAMGVAQMQRLAELLSAKRELATFYANELGGVVGIRLPPEAEWATSTHWLYTVEVDPDAFGHDAVGLSAHLDAAGIASRPVFTPMHLLGIHDGRQAQSCVNAERIARTGLTLPSSTTLSIDQLRRVTTAIKTSTLRAGS